MSVDIQRLKQMANLLLIESLMLVGIHQSLNIVWDRIKMG